MARAPNPWAASRPDRLGARWQGTWTFYLYDLQGSAVQRLGGAGAPLSASCYDAYGRDSSTGGASDPFAFNARWGYCRDAETGGGLYLCGHRYDDSMGRWETRDPIGFSGGVNLYGYCGQEPVAYIDPSGYWGLSLNLCAGGMIGLGVIGINFEGCLGVSLGNDGVGVGGPSAAVLVLDSAWEGLLTLAQRSASEMGRSITDILHTPECEVSDS